MIYSLMMTFTCIAFRIMWNDETQIQIAVMFICHCIVTVIKRILPTFFPNIYTNEIILLISETVNYTVISLAVVTGIDYVRIHIGDPILYKICSGFLFSVGIMLFLSLMSQIFHIFNGLYYILLGILTITSLLTAFIFLLIRWRNVSVRNKLLLLGTLCLIISFVGAVVCERFDIDSISVGILGIFLYFCISAGVLLFGIYELKHPKKPTPKIKAEDVLSQAEFAVFEQMRDTDMRNTEIAAELGLSLNTVKTHIRSIYKKLKVQNRDEFTKIY